MDAPKTVAVLVGSLRKASLSRKIAHALVERAPDSLRFDVVPLGDLPLYDEDLEGNVPAAWSRFRGAIAASAAVLFVTPEYNRSIPGGLKNALDVGSRPEGQNVFAGKPAAIASVTPYRNGAFGANHALRQSLVFLDMPAMQQPELYVGNAAELLDEAGGVKDPATGKLLSKFMTSFARWIDVVTDAGGEPAKGEAFEAFLKRREKIAEAYVRGDPGPLRALAPSKHATFFSPGGGAIRGVEQVFERYEKDARRFEPGGRSRLEVLQSASSDDVGFWSGYQVAEANLKGEKGAVPMRLRVTEVFHREGGQWKMIHRHADRDAEVGGPER